MGVRPKGFIENYKPTTASRALIERISAILVEYAAFLPLTVRQIFYRLVGTGDGYEKTDLAYKRLVDLIGNSRRGGMIDFDAIRDDGMTRQDAFDYTGVDDFLSSHRAALRMITSSIARSASRSTPSWAARLAAWCPSLRAWRIRSVCR